MNISTKTDKKYFIQHCYDNDWGFCNMPEIQGGLRSEGEITGVMEKVMTHHNDFVLANYRAVSRTVVIIDEVLSKFKDR